MKKFLYLILLLLFSFNINSSEVKNIIAIKCKTENDFDRLKKIISQLRENRIIAVSGVKKLLVCVIKFEKDQSLFSAKDWLDRNEIVCDYIKYSNLDFLQKISVVS